MREDLKLYILAPLFAVAGAVATALLWKIAAATILPSIPDRYAVLACVLVGLLGPLVVWLLVWGGCRRSDRTAFLRPAAVGLGLAAATELAFYVPIGFLTVAFYGQTL